jgi:hypothetical protein
MQPGRKTTRRLQRKIDALFSVLAQVTVHSQFAAIIRRLASATLVQMKQSRPVMRGELMQSTLNRFWPAGFGAVTGVFLLAAALNLSSTPGFAADDNGQTIQGSGATFPAPLYQRWFVEYNKLHPDVQINY